MKIFIHDFSGHLRILFSCTSKKYYINLGKISINLKYVNLLHFFLHATKNLNDEYF